MDHQLYERVNIIHNLEIQINTINLQNQKKNKKENHQIQTSQTTNNRWPILYYNQWRIC